MHLARYIEYWARQRADHPALIGPRVSLTWRDVGVAAATFAAQLRAAGAERGDRIGILLGNRLEWCVAFAGMQLAETMCVPLNPLFGPNELRFVADDAGCTLVVSTPKLMTRFGTSSADFDDDRVKLFRLNAAEPVGAVDLFPSDPRQAPERVEDDAAPAAICYTSGTTGLPKGAVHTHRSIEAMTTSLSRGYGMTTDDTFLLCAPLSFTGGVICNLTVSLSIGSRLIVESGFDPARALALIERHRVTSFGGAAIFWQRLAQVDGFDAADISSLRCGFVGGSPISPGLVRRFVEKGVGIRQAYGCTEIGGGATLPTSEQARLRPEACGHPMIGLEIELRDDEDRPVASGEIGEIVMRGPQLMAGYWNQPDLTARAMAGGWYHSGDLGRYNEQGELLVVDRKKNMVISGGVNIYPAEVEAVMSGLPGVREAAAFGVPSDVWGEELVAIVVSDAALDEAATIACLKNLLGAYKAPKRLTVRDMPLPRTSTGKIERTALPALFHA